MTEEKPQQKPDEKTEEQNLNFFFLLADSNLKIVRADKRSLRIFGRGIMGKSAYEIKCPLCKSRIFQSNFLEAGKHGDAHFRTYILPFFGKEREYLLVLEDVQKEEKKDAEYKFFSLEKFAGGISHDINNILSAVNSAVFVIKQTPSFPQIREEVSNIEKAVEDLSFVSANFLFFSQRKFMSFRPLAITRAIEDAAGEARAQISHKYPGRKCYKVFGNEKSLKKAFKSVFSEMKRVSKGKGIELRCRLLNSETLQITVGAKGFVLSDEERKAFFEPYSSLTDNRKKFSLSVAYGIIRQHGGEIFPSSESHKKTNIVIKLPVMK